MVNATTVVRDTVTAVVAASAICAVTGCAIPAGVDPLPYFAEDASGNEVETPQLCVLYHRYDFLDGGVDTCHQEGWKLLMLTEEQLKDVAYRSRRNELQHTMLSMATSMCSNYRQELTERSETVMVAPSLLGLVVSAATLGADSVAKELAAAGSAFNSISQLSEETYTNNLQNTQMGIEAERTRIFKQILYSQSKNLVAYPVARAVNDAKRYHGVCNRTDGKAQAARALSGQITNPD